MKTHAHTLAAASTFRTLALALTFLAGCGSSGTSGGNDNSSAAECTSDNDCKGDRVCEQGACVDPGAGGGSNTDGASGSGGASTGGASGSGGASTGGAGAAGGAGGAGGSSSTKMCGGLGFQEASCNTCFQTSCCDTGSTCANDSECAALYSCVTKCASGDNSCVQSCTNAHSSGVSDLNALLSCTQSSCASECGFATKGVGDACTSSADCESGMCSGSPGWCTKTCTQNTDCASSSSSLTNANGELVWCVETKNGADYCFPGCAQSSCSAYGASCDQVTVVNGNVEPICSK